MADAGGSGASTASFGGKVAAPALTGSGSPPDEDHSASTSFRMVTPTGRASRTVSPAATRRAGVREEKVPPRRSSTSSPKRKDEGNQPEGRPTKDELVMEIEELRQTREQQEEREERTVKTLEMDGDQSEE